MGLVRVKKPTTHKGRKALQNREPKLLENTKQSLFFKGRKTSEVINGVLKDLLALKKPDAMTMNGKKDVLPFEDPTLLETTCKKFDSNLIFFGSHTKKRPNNLVVGRTHDHHILDLVELGVDYYKGFTEFGSETIAMGLKPILSFIGPAFKDDPTWARIKNLFVDLFHRDEVTSIRLQGLEHVLCFTQDQDQLFLRSYRVCLKKSGTTLPRIELEEIGPSIDMTLRRHKLASEDYFKSACKKPKALKAKKVKNIKMDAFGSQLGRVHIRQGDVKKLQTRKMKGLRKTAAEKKEFRQKRKQLAKQST